MLQQVLVLMQAEKEHFTALHLTGMDVGYNGHNAFGKNMSRCLKCFPETLRDS